MGMNYIDKLKASNKLFINAKPVFMGEPNEEIYLQYRLVGAVWLKPVYTKSKVKLMRRIGDKIYITYPYGTDKALIEQEVNSNAIYTRVRKYITENIKLPHYPSRNMSGSPSDGFILIAGKKFNLKVRQALNSVISLIGNTYYITYRKDPAMAEKAYRDWRREMSRNAFLAAMDRACELNGFPKSKMPIRVTNGSGFVYKTQKIVHVCIPEGTSALADAELDCVALYYVLMYDYKYDLEQLRATYPHLHEVIFYIVRRIGLRIDRDELTQQMDRTYSDNYIARHGEKVYKLIDKIIVGKSCNVEEKLHLFGSVYLP